MNNEINEMLLINTKQKAYYEDKEDINLNHKGNLITQLWRKIRRKQIKLRKEIGVQEYILDLHKEWLGNLKNKNVLDLGCYSGNDLSLYIASESKSYLGLDLSSTAIEELNKKLVSLGNPNALGKSEDFLSYSFQSKHYAKFDVIYAYSVFHHFKHFDAFLKAIDNCLAKDGIVITFDPLKTYLPMKVMRNLYRPFQSDKDWEYPFDKAEITLIKKFFVIGAVQGIFGKVKRAFLIYIFNSNKGGQMARKLFEIDKQTATNTNKFLWDCLQVTMLLRKK